MDHLSGMSLSIDVNLTGRIDTCGKASIRAAYRLTASDPGPEHGGVIVDGYGNINLENQEFDPSLHLPETSITFSLSGMVTDAKGGSVSYSFPADAAQAVSIVSPCEDGRQLTPRCGGDPKQVIIDSKNTDGLIYSYCLAVLLGSDRLGSADCRDSDRCKRTIVRLDPSFHNRRV